MNLRPKHERLLRDIYKRDGSVDEQKLSFFKHYLQQKPMKIAETMGILKEYAKKYAIAKSYEKHMTTMIVSSHLIQDYAMFCTSFEISALKLIKTHLKEILKIISKDESSFPPGYPSKCKEEMRRCFHLFTYAGTRSSKAEKVSTHILLALCTAIDSGFTSVRKEALSNAQMYEALTQLYANKWSTFSSLHLRKKELTEEEKTSPGKEVDGESYSTDASLSYNFADGSCNYTEDKSSSSSSFFSAPDLPLVPAKDADREDGNTLPEDSAPTSLTNLSHVNSTQTNLTQPNLTQSNLTQPAPSSLEMTEGLSGLAISRNNFSGHLKGAMAQGFISPAQFVVHPNEPRVAQTDAFLLSLLSSIIKSAGILVHHTEKKILGINRTVVKAAPFNEEIRQEIFISYFQMLSPTVIPAVVKQIIEISSEREIEDIHKILYNTINVDLYSDLLIQSNVILSNCRTKIFGGVSVEKSRHLAIFLLLQTTLFLNTINVAIPPARMTKSFYFLLRALYPKKSLFRKVAITDNDMQERVLTIKYFKLFISKCQDKEIVFLSLLRRAFQKEAGIGSSSVPSDLKLLIAKELEQSLLETEKCTSLSLFELLLDIAQSSSLQFREHINSALGIMVEREILGKRSQFEEHKRKSVFARVRTLAVAHGGLYTTLLKKSLPTINKSEIRTVAGVFSAINEVSGLDECSKYVDISEGTVYNLEEDNKLCNRESSIQGSSIRSGTTFGGIRKSSIRLFEIFRKLNR
ncbi:hypothetical protein NEHOM01_0347 [Nematocida homosporus]|uniref:uncharacterized protein n=1 Tax=Nematocida homosporus TaxID=1912981 RepID=UPI00221E77A3|nr:uncharacterized protein NEHOM01_0347 [Nematocida homosporus]KAI5184745.1 hypothetical protein NEHOM01_0347 [Nematocida homosporus]